MLTAVIADIHGNLQALQAVLSALDKLNVRQILCAGDIVGYGGNPAECIDLIRQRNIPCCCGNHDSYVADESLMPKEKVRPEAQEVILWTRKQLSQEQLSWLGELPLTLQSPEFMVTHASCQPYPKWVYVTSRSAAALHLLFQSRQLCFNGHCHIPIIAAHLPKKKLTLEYLDDRILSKEGNVMVGVGAVGQPRDEDNRACTVLFNTNTRKVTLLRIKYDIAAAQQAIVDKKLPVFLADRLLKGI